MPDRQPDQDVRGSRGLNFLQVFLGFLVVPFLLFPREDGDEGVPAEVAEQLPGAAETRQRHRHRRQGPQACL